MEEKIEEKMEGRLDKGMGEEVSKLMEIQIKLAHNDRKAARRDRKSARKARKGTRLFQNDATNS